MHLRFRRDVLRTVLLTALLAGARVAAAQQTLKIVVIAGEDAVNVVQQKTAVAPIVEVRDRNDQPVSGAVVTFAIRSGRATLSGSRTLSITTNATGRAIASGLTPTGTGALKISATAAFHGQTTTAVTIAQTNVMTAAQAAAAAAGASGAGTGGAGTAGTSAAGGAGGASSGGISATTLGIVGGAAAAGTIVATKALGGAEGTPYAGTYAGPIVVAGPPPFCGFTINVSGTLTIRIEDASAGSFRGSAHIDEHNAIHYNASCRLNDLTPFDAGYDAPLAGTPDNLSFTISHENTFTDPNGSGNTGRRIKTFSFTGAFDGTQIIGTLTNTEATQAITGPPIDTSGTTAFPMTLR